MNATVEVKEAQKAALFVWFDYDIEKYRFVVKCNGRGKVSGIEDSQSEAWRLARGWAECWEEKAAS